MPHLCRYSQNNYPLRGGKFTDFQGGVRATAFLSGGWLPAQLRGRRFDGYVHIADWYVTFGRLAGLSALARSDSPANSSVPPTDSIDVWDAILSNSTLGPSSSGGSVADLSPRSEIALSSFAIIVGDWKLVVNEFPPSQKFNRTNFGLWTGPVWPNAADSGMVLDPGCPAAGCLFNIAADPLEQLELSDTEPGRVAALRARLYAENRSYFQAGDPGLQYFGRYTACRSVQQVCTTALLC